jgi:integrase
MLKADLEAAEIPYVDDAGLFADFHALRHSFISMLAAGNVHPKLAQRLARHSNINLTMMRYTHSRPADEAQALHVLPAFPSVFDGGMDHCKAVGATGNE